MSDANPIIQVDGLRKVYQNEDGQKHVAVGDVTFDVERGAVLGILGPNGAGKTTVIQSILGLVKPTRGRILVDGIDVARNPTEAYERIAFTLEGARNIYWRLTVWENIRFFAGLHGIDYRNHREEFRRNLEMLNLGDRADTEVRDLSRGMKQKCYIACALARRSPILLLDEPTIGLDLQTKNRLKDELRRLVRTENRTIVITSHNLGLMEETCDEVLIMDRGEIREKDSVENLTNIWDADTFEVRIDSAIEDAVRRRIDDEVRIKSWQVDDDFTAFEAVVFSEDDYFGLMDALGQAGLQPTAVRRKEADLEGVYVRLAENENRAGSVSQVNQ
jgi:ABC-2 type transport system ATP-binding protein